MPTTTGVLNAFGAVTEPNFLCPKIHIKIDNWSLVVTFFFLPKISRLMKIISYLFRAICYRHTKGRNTANLVHLRAHVSAMGLRPLMVPDWYLAQNESALHPNRTSQADDSCFCRGIKQEPTLRVKASTTRLLWKSRRHRCKFCLFRAPLSNCSALTYIRRSTYASFPA